MQTRTYLKKIDKKELSSERENCLKNTDQKVCFSINKNNFAEYKIIYHMKTPNLSMIVLLIVTIFCSVESSAQSRRMIDVNVAPERGDWLYKTGDKVKFNISVTRNDVNLKDVEIRYEISEDMMAPQVTKTIILKDGKTTIDAGTMKKPGFLRCTVYAKYDGKEYQGLGTAGFNPEKIEPTTTLPADFLSFWDNAKAENAKIPMDAKVTLLPERCTEKVNVYHVNLQNYRRGARLYAIMCIPKAPGKYPALLRVPGAGIRPYNGDIGNAEKGMITFEIGIHGVPVTMPVSFYNDLASGPLAGYMHFNLDNKDEYYYKRVYMGCVRAIDYIYSLAEFDGSNLFVAGGSQGGALSIITAGLDSRVKGLIAFYPALSDVTGYANGRAGGWPHMFRNDDKNDPIIKRKIENSKYYDVVNFARQVKVPGFYSSGYNDLVCPPTSMHSTYNVITAPKTMYIMEETGHWTYPEQWEKAWEWMYKQLGK